MDLEAQRLSTHGPVALDQLDNPYAEVPIPSTIELGVIRSGMLISDGFSGSCLSAAPTRQNQESDPDEQPPVHSGHEDDTEDGVANCRAPNDN